MPKFYCDYCDVFLTHDSASVRKAHNTGKSHAQNLRDYYAQVALEMAELESHTMPVKIREARSGLRMPEPIPGKGYGSNPVYGLPLSVPYGIPQRPGFPAQTIIPPGYIPHVAPGCIAPSVPNQPAPKVQIPGSMMGPGGVLVPPKNLPANFSQMQADFQQQYSTRGGAERPNRGEARRY